LGHLIHFEPNTLVILHTSVRGFLNLFCQSRLFSTLNIGPAEKDSHLFFLSYLLSFVLTDFILSLFALWFRLAVHFQMLALCHLALLSRPQTLLTYLHPLDMEEKRELWGTTFNVSGNWPLKVIISVAFLLFFPYYC
jgi:hypothetical protein